VDLYSARISPSARIAEDVEYHVLLERIAEYTLRAAFAHAIDEHDWEQEELRRRGLRAVELFHNARAVWLDRIEFERLQADARSGGAPAFETSNELDAGLLERIDRDLQARWRRAGYTVDSLACEMRKLFAQLEADAIDRSREARDHLLTDVLQAGSDGPKGP
jgi:hypothetical protein